ncbi:MAG: SIMPL domain-containing protein [Rhodobacteraceae bacterium]|nr:SIMPL domain-containing protein [Paracoccaceae bacterium]
MSSFTPLLRTLPVAALFAAALWTAVPARAETQPALITVTGEASVEQAPDMATVSIGVTSVSATAAQALSANSEAMRAVIDRLKAAGVADVDLQTTGLSVNPNWTGYDSSASEQRISGYTAANTLTVQIRVLETLGTVLDAAVSDGANTLNGLTFGLADPRPALDAARRSAVLDARAKAELLAEAAGVKLGAIVSISEGGGYGNPVPMYKAAASDSAVPVQQGQVSYQASVSVVWQLAQ